MSTIVTRAGKGSALTWTEADNNITNLNTDKMESFTVAGDSGTSQTVAGGNTLTIAGGTNLNSVASATDIITVNLDTTVTGLTSLTSTTVVTDAINGSTANSPITIAPDGTGDVHLNTDSVRIGDNNSDATLATRGTGDLILTTNEGSGTEGIIRIYDGVNGNITLSPNGTGKVIITNLQVDGTTTTVNSTTVTVDDPIFTLGGDTAPASDDNKDRGIEFRWHNGTSAKVGFFGFDDSTGYLTFIPDATNTSEVFSGTLGDIEATNFRGALVGNASTATTATTATNVTVTQVSTSATYYPLMATTNGTGDKAPVLGTNFTMNPSSGALTAVSLTTSGSITPNSTGGPNINFGTSTLTASAWTTLGISLRQQARNYTDSSSTGTVAVSAINGFGISTLNSTNAITVTEASTFYIQPPAATGNTTITTAYGLISTGRIKASDFVGTIGATTASTGAFTTLTATGAVTLSPASLAVAISPTGTGTVAISPAGALTINPTTASTINNTSIGATTASTGRFTTVTSTIATGTAPFTVASTTNVANLNASSLNGATFAAPGAIGGTTKAAGTFTTMTADVSVLDDIRETVFALTYGATITPDAANGSIQTVTLTGNVTFSAFSNPVSGQTITLIITQDGTGSRTLTSTMKFAGGSKTLSTAASSIDILTVSYIGTTYYASLAKAFA